MRIFVSFSYDKSYEFLETEHLFGNMEINCNEEIGSIDGIDDIRALERHIQEELSFLDSLSRKYSNITILNWKVF